MITPADLWLAYFAGVSGGLLLPLGWLLVRVWRDRRRDEVLRRRWRATNLFRG